MVHPYMRQAAHMLSSESADSVAEKVVAMLSRVHVLVIGPGLGREELMQETCVRVIKAAREKGIPFILDADGLLIAQQRDEVLQGYEDCILTPNIVEFGRLCKAKGVELSSDPAIKEEQMPDKVAELATKFGHVTILAKGTKDTISNGHKTMISDGEGGLKRSGGQGDTLTGVLGTLFAWRKAYFDRLWEHDASMSKEESLALVAYGGSAITRECSRLAFKEKGRSMQAGDLTEHVHEAFLTVVGEPAESKL